MKKTYETPRLEVLGDVLTITGMVKAFGFGDPSGGSEEPPLPS